MIVYLRNEVMDMVSSGGSRRPVGAGEILKFLGLFWGFHTEGWLLEGFQGLITGSREK